MSFGRSVRRYYRGDELVAVRQEPAGQPASTRYYHFDHQGTTQCLTDSTGAITDRFAANAWGVEVKRTGSSINRQWYIGNHGYQRQDRMLDYVRLRYYSASPGLFLSVDTADGPERYVYAQNNPIRMVDPSGALPASFDVGWVQANAFIPGRFGMWMPEPPGIGWEFNTNNRGFGGGSSKIWCELFFHVSALRGIRVRMYDCDTGITRRRRFWMGRYHYDKPRKAKLGGLRWKIHSK